MDPSLIPVTPASALQAPAVISGMSGGVVGGDGNNTQYWNALIDGMCHRYKRRGNISTLE